ncbi:MAG: phenylphosphate carboxylase subunit delta [candidate division Zixibacteria bacterium]|nr:phenylphosphate carboxylase subunit delta [candidate division Zixibacteria bacterium]
MLALDVDGVLTDDKIYFGPDGFEMKQFNISDGFFMVLAMRSGLELAIVSGRCSPATDTRMKDLGVKHVLQGMKDKVEMIRPLLNDLGVSFDQVAFMGNELLDIKLARKVALSIGPSDGSPRFLDEASYVTSKPGGNGAVREVLECYFEAIGIDPQSYII